MVTGKARSVLTQFETGPTLAYLSQRNVPAGTRRNPIAGCAEPLNGGAVIRLVRIVFLISNMGKRARRI